MTLTRRKAISLILVNGNVEQTPFYYVAFCDELPITANGETPEEAVEGIVDGAIAYLDALRKLAPQEYQKKINELLHETSTVKANLIWSDDLFADEKPVPVPITIPEQVTEMLAHAAGR